MPFEAIRVWRNGAVGWCDAITFALRVRRSAASPFGWRSDGSSPLTSSPGRRREGPTKPQRGVLISSQKRNRNARVFEKLAPSNAGAQDQAETGRPKNEHYQIDGFAAGNDLLKD